METYFKKILFVGALCLVWGCAPVLSDKKGGFEGQGGLSEITFQVEYLGARGLSKIQGGVQEEFLIAFAVDSGNIWEGELQKKELFQKKVFGEGRFTLDLEEKRKAVRGLARRFKPNSYTRKLEVSPKSTKFARMPGMVFSLKTMKQTASMGIIDPVSRDFLILVYVDRPCRIQGEATPMGNYYKFDVNLEGEGFHLLRLHREEGGRLVKEFDLKEDIILAVIFPEDI